MRFAFIRDLAAEQPSKPRSERIPVGLMCQVLGVSRAGYYAWAERAPSKHDLDDGELTERIIALDEEHQGRLGVERLTVELAKAGHRHSPKRVRRLARAAGLMCVHPRPYRATTIPDPANNHGLVDLVGRDFVPEAPGQLWHTDITYIKVSGRWAYLAAIIDGHTRKIVGWALDTHLRTCLATDALSMAIASENPTIGECIIHADRGAQFTSAAFRDLALSNGIIPSVGHTGICYDNAMAESFNATIKKELIHLHAWPSIDQLRKEVFTYIEIYYNRKRPHSRLGYLTPWDIEQQWAAKLDNDATVAA